MSGNIHLDGNSIGGLLNELFGQEMTGRFGSCGVCGAVMPFAEVHVYRDAPGDVIRCPSCGSVLVVVISGETGYRVTLESLRWIEFESSID